MGTIESAAASLPPTLAAHQGAIVEYCKRHSIRKLALFGSFLTGQARPDSDIDLLVEFEPGRAPGLIRLGAMTNELSALLARPVDLRTAQDLSRYFRDQVVASARTLHERS